MDTNKSINMGELIPLNLNFVFIVIILVFGLINCSDDTSKGNDNSTIVLNNHILKLQDSIQYFYTDSLLIGNIARASVWNNYFVITDSKLKQLVFFDTNFTFVKKIGRIGEGPGEFVSLPILVQNSDSIIVCEPKLRKAFYYDENFDLIKTVNLDPNFIYHYQPIIKIKDKIILSASYPYSISDMEYFEKYNSIIVLDDKFNFVQTFLPWDNIYLNEKFNAFVTHNSQILLAYNNDGGFFANQLASRNIYNVDEKFNIKNKFGKYPINYKSPPEGIKPEQVQKSFESVIEYNSKITTKYSLSYDSNKNYLFLYYKNTTKDMFLKRDFFSGQHLLQIYDQANNIIFDKDINGVFLFSFNGKIYVLNKEEPKSFSINIYSLEHNKSI